MIEIFKPREHHLLRSLILSENKIFDLKNKIIENEVNLEKRTALEKELEETYKLIPIFEKELENIEDKSNSKTTHWLLKRQIECYLAQINQPKKQGLRLCAKQKKPLKIGDEVVFFEGKVFLIGQDNALIYRIISDVRRLVTYDAGLLYIPADLVYTEAKEETIEISDLSYFLNFAIGVLDNIKDINFLTLRQFVKEFTHNILTQFKQ